MKDTSTGFTKKVIELIQSVPQGKVATYGLIARLAGKPRGSRQVGWLLHSGTKKYALPWQRIIKSDGSLSFPMHSEHFTWQKQALEAEGIMVENGKVDLEIFLWRKDSFSPQSIF